MAVIHIPEEETAKDLPAVLSRVGRGEDIVIDTPRISIRLVPDAKPQLRTGAEMLEIYANLPGDRGLMDEDFARDVLEFRKRHPESIDGSKWD